MPRAIEYMFYKPATKNSYPNRNFIGNKIFGMLITLVTNLFCLTFYMENTKN